MSKLYEAVDNFFDSQIFGEADISIDTDLNSAASSKAENYLYDMLKGINSDYTLDDIVLWMTPKGNINVRTKDNKDIVTLDRSNFTDSDIDELRNNGYFDDYASATMSDMDESEELIEKEVPASQLDFKHQQLAKVQDDIEIIAELKAEDTSNDLYTNLLDAYDKIVEILTDAIAEDPIGTVIGSDESSDEVGLTVDEEPVDVEGSTETPEEDIKSDLDI